MAFSSGPPVHAQPSDSTAADSLHPASDAAAGDWLVLPFLSYEPKTKLATGVVGGYFQPNRPGRTPSSVQTGVTITQERQIILQLTPEFFYRDGQRRLAGEITLSRFPDEFFGIGGDTPADAAEDFTSRYATVEASLQRAVGDRLLVGPRVYGRLEMVTDTEDDGRLATQGIPGVDGGRTLGIGVAAVAEGRDNIYQPTDGSFVEAAALWHSAVLGSDYTFGRFTGDLRAYRSAGPITFAGQVYAEGVVGTPPFQILPLLGGSQRMRGYREGRYRDAVYWTTQAEVRAPLFWRFRATAFASVGEVGPRIGAHLFRNVQGAVGLGGRLRLNDEGVHGRADLAYGADGFEIYLSLLEAF